jgi:GntR family transcriptional regulator
VGANTSGNTPGRRSKAVDIAAALRAAIHAGKYGPGVQLPSNAALQDEHHAANQTVQSALKILRDEGLVEGRPGAGVFVRERPTVKRLNSRRLSRAEREAGRGAMVSDGAASGFTPRSDVTVTFEHADPATAETLRIAEGDEVVVRDRVMHADGIPVQLATSRLPRSITRGSRIEEPDTGDGGTYARLEELGHRLDRAEETVTARPATVDEAELLRIQPGAPVFEVVRVVYIADGTPVEVNRMVLVGERYQLVYEIDMT